MQRGGRAARRLRQFGNVDLDTSVQEIEAKSKYAVDGNLPHPWDVQRDENETCCGERAAGDHQMALPYMGDESRNREGIENAAHGERGDQQSRDRGTRLANRKQQQRHVRKEPVDENCFEEHGCEADLGARIGKNATEIIPPATSPAATRMATSSEKLVATAQTSADNAITSRHRFISRVLPKKSPVTPSAGCTNAYGNV